MKKRAGVWMPRLIRVNPMPRNKIDRAISATVCRLGAATGVFGGVTKYLGSE